MTIRQMHYSSVERGPEGGSGFQFTSIDPEVDAGTRGHIEQLLRYEPPDDLTAVPDADELRAFPVAFSHTRLPTGASVLCRTRYVGQDYSGRQGNFHAHAMWAHDGDFGPAPWRSWKSPQWRADLPAAGPVRALDALTPGREPDLDDLVDFAMSRRDDVEPFLADVFRLFADDDARRIVVCERDPEHVLYWIALASLSLEERHARRLTFTTYTRRPYLAVQQIIGISPGSDFAYSDTEVNHQYRVHGSVARQRSPESADERAAGVAALWLAGDREELTALSTGEIDLPHDPDGRDPQGRWAAHGLARGKTEHVDLAIRWLARHTDGGTDRFWAGVGATLVSIEERLGPATLERVVDHLGPALPLDHREQLQVTAILRNSRDGDFGDPDVLSSRITGRAARERLTVAMRELLAHRVDALTRSGRTDAPGETARMLRMAEHFGADYRPRSGVLAELLVRDLLRADRDTLAHLHATEYAELRDWVLDLLDAHDVEHPGRLRDLLARPEFNDFVRTRAGDRHRLAMTARAERVRATTVGDRALLAALWDKRFPTRQWPELVAHAVRIVYAGGRAMTLEGATYLLEQVPGEDLREADLAERLQEPLHEDIEPDAATIELADLLARAQIGELTTETKLFLLVDILRNGTPPRDSVGSLNRLLKTLPPRSRLAIAARKALIDRLLVHGPRSGFRSEIEIGALAESGDDELLKLYQRGVCDSAWRRAFPNKPDLMAQWFIALRRADQHASPSSAWHATRARIEKDAIVKIVQDRGRATGFAEAAARRLDESLALQWRALFEKKTRLSWRFRRSDPGPGPDPVPAPRPERDPTGDSHPRPIPRRSRRPDHPYGGER